MPFLDWLFRRTPTETQEAPQIGGHVTHDPTPIIDDADPPESAAPDAAHHRRCALEPYFAMIEYVDAMDNRTRRRITMRSVHDRDGTMYLSATCHERRAMRSFRLDRIKCLISQDGEIEDAAAFFADVLASADWQDAPQGTSPRPAKSPPKAAAVSPYTALRREITPALTILIAAARSDDLMHPRETAAILRYAEDEAALLRHAGILPGNAEADAFAKLERTIARLRPTRDDVTQALAALRPWDRDRAARLAAAIAATAAADGRVDDVEAAMLDDLRAFGSSLFGAGWDE